MIFKFWIGWLNVFQSEQMRLLLVIVSWLDGWLVGWLVGCPEGDLTKQDLNVVLLMSDVSFSPLNAVTFKKVCYYTV